MRRTTSCGTRMHDTPMACRGAQCGVALLMSVMNSSDSRGLRPGAFVRFVEQLEQVRAAARRRPHARLRLGRCCRWLFGRLGRFRGWRHPDSLRRAARRAPVERSGDADLPEAIRRVWQRVVRIFATHRRGKCRRLADECLQRPTSVRSRAKCRHDHTVRLVRGVQLHLRMQPSGVSHRQPRRQPGWLVAVTVGAPRAASLSEP